MEANILARGIIVYNYMVKTLQLATEYAYNYA